MFLICAAVCIASAISFAVMAAGHEQEWAKQKLEYTVAIENSTIDILEKNDDDKKNVNDILSIIADNDINPAASGFRLPTYYVTKL